MPQLDASTGKQVAPAPKPRPKLKPRTTQTFERPAPAHRNESIQPTRHRLAGSAMKTRQLTSRQTRLNEQYGQQFQRQTGRSLRGERGLMRALLEEGIASAHDLQGTLQTPGQQDFQRGHKLHEGLGATGSPSIVDNTDYGTLGTSMTRPHNSSTLATNPAALAEFSDRIARQVHLPPIDTLAASGGERGQPGLAGHAAPGPADPDKLAFDVIDNLRAQGVDETNRDAVVARISAHNPGWAQSLYRASTAHAMIDDPSARATKFKEASATDPGDIQKAILLATGIGGAGRLLAGAVGRAATSTALRTATTEAAGGAVGTAAKTALGAAARSAPSALGRGALATGKAVFRPGRTISRIAARGPLARIGAGTAILAAPAALHQAGYSVSNFHQLTPDLTAGLNPLGAEAAQAAQAQGGELTKEQIDHIRKIGGGVLITSQNLRNQYLARAQANGWDDNQHTDDVTIIQHAMLGAPSGARRFLGRAFHGAAVLSDIPGGAQAALGAALQSERQRSLRPGLEFVQKGFVDPTLFALQHPGQSFAENPVLTATVLMGAARGAGALGGHVLPVGEGVRTATLPGRNEPVVIGPRASNLVDRTAQYAHDRFISSRLGRVDIGKPGTATYLPSAAVHFQTKQGTGQLSIGQHRADAARRKVSAAYQQAFQHLTPSQAEAVNEVGLINAPHNERPTMKSYLQDFDLKIAGIQRDIAGTEKQLMIQRKQAELAGPDSPEAGLASATLDRLDRQQAMLARVAALRNEWEHNPAKFKHLADVTRESARVFAADAPRVAELAGQTMDQLVQRGFAERQAHDVALHEAISEDIKGQFKQFRRARKAHETTVAGAQQRLEGARMAAQQAAAGVERARVPAEPVAAAANGPVAPTDPVSAQLQQILQRDYAMPRTRANRSQANQAVVENAARHVGTEFTTADGERGIVTGLTIVGESRRKRAQYETRIIAKDGTVYPKVMTGREFEKVRPREPVPYEGGFTRPAPLAVHHPQQPDVYGDVTDQTGPVVYAKEQVATGPRIGVARTGNQAGVGRPVGGGVHEGYQVVLEMNDGAAFAVPGAHFHTALEARRFAKDAAARPGDSRGAVKAALRDRQNAVSNASEPTFNEPQPAPQPQVETAYHHEHRPPGPTEGHALSELPDHLRSPRGKLTPAEQEAVSVAQRVHGNPDAEVTVYRALPADVADRGVAAGDWVTTSRKYADEHARISSDIAGGNPITRAGHGDQHMTPGPPWKVVAVKVRAGDLRTSDELPLPEYGYHGPKVEPTQRVTRDRIKQGRARVERVHRQVAKLRAEAGQRAAAGEPLTLSISRPLIDAIIERGHSKSGALIAELKKASGKVSAKVALPAEHVPALRAELVRLSRLKATDAKGRGRVAAAKRALEQLPQTTAGRGRVAATAAAKTAKADHLEARANALSRELDKADRALTAAETHASGERAASARSETVAAAEQRLAAANEALAKTEAEVAKILGEKPPERPNREAIVAKHRLGNAQDLMARGAQPFYRPHRTGEIRARGTAAYSNQGHATVRTDAADVFGRNRLEANDLVNLRAGKVTSGVQDTLRSAGAVHEADQIALANDRLLSNLGQEVHLPEGETTLGARANVDSRRRLGQLLSSLENRAGAVDDHAIQSLFDGMFEPARAGDFGIPIHADQTVVKTPSGRYFIVPVDALDQIQRWFSNTLKANAQHPGWTQTFTKAWRTQALNTTPTTPINNFLGNVMLGLTGGAGPLSFYRAARAVRGQGRHGQLPPVEQFGSGNAGATTGVLAPGHGLFGNRLLGGGRGAASSTLRHYINFNRSANVMAEDYGRLALWFNRAIKEAKRQQYAGRRLGALQARIRIANDETFKMIESGQIDFEKVHAQVNHFFGDLYKRSRFDKSLFLAVPFHRWFRHMVTLALVTMPLRYPGRSAFLQELGQVGEDYRKEHGVFPEWMRGVILTGTEFLPSGIPGMPNEATNTLSTSGFNPYSSVTQIIGGGVGGGANPLLLGVASWLTGQHVEDIGNATNTLFSGEGGTIRQNTDRWGHPIQIGTSDWLRNGAHEIAGMIPLVTKAFPSSGRSDNYVPIFDDKIFGHRLGADEGRTYKGPAPRGATLYPWLEPAETPRHTGHIGPIPIPTSTISRFFGVRTTPYYTGGPAFEISAKKTFQRAKATAAQKRGSHRGNFRPDNPKP